MIRNVSFGWPCAVLNCQLLGRKILSAELNLLFHIGRRFQIGNASKIDHLNAKFDTRRDLFSCVISMLCKLLVIMCVICLIVDLKFV